MFMLGEFDVYEAKDIADCLKDAGMKVDIRTFTSSNLEVFHYLEGRMSELKTEWQSTGTLLIYYMIFWRFPMRRALSAWF